MKTLNNSVYTAVGRNTNLNNSALCLTPSHKSNSNLAFKSMISSESKTRINSTMSTALRSIQDKERQASTLTNHNTFLKMRLTKLLEEIKQYRATENSYRKKLQLLKNHQMEVSNENMKTKLKQDITFKQFVQSKQTESNIAYKELTSVISALEASKNKLLSIIHDNATVSTENIYHLQKNSKECESEIAFKEQEIAALKQQRAKLIKSIENQQKAMLNYTKSIISVIKS